MSEKPVKSRYSKQNSYCAAVKDVKNQKLIFREAESKEAYGVPISKIYNNQIRDKIMKYQSSIARSA